MKKFKTLFFCATFATTCIAQMDEAALLRFEQHQNMLALNAAKAEEQMLKMQIKNDLALSKALRNQAETEQNFVKAEANYVIGDGVFSASKIGLSALSSMPGIGAPAKVVTSGYTNALDVIAEIGSPASAAMKTGVSTGLAGWKHIVADNPAQVPIASTAGVAWKMYRIGRTAVEYFDRTRGSYKGISQALSSIPQNKALSDMRMNMAESALPKLKYSRDRIATYSEKAIIGEALAHQKGVFLPLNDRPTYIALKSQTTLDANSKIGCSILEKAGSRAEMVSKTLDLIQDYHIRPTSNPVHFEPYIPKNTYTPPAASPSWSVPKYTAPSYTPSYTSPSYTSPSYNLPSYSAPKIPSYSGNNSVGGYKLKW